VKRDADRVSIVAGLAIGGLGVVLLLDRLGGDHGGRDR